LAVEVSYRLAKRLDVLGLILHQAGDHERTYLFPVERFAEVAAVVLPRKRRRLSEENRAKLVAAGTAALARHKANVQAFSEAVIAADRQAR
jgi:hypothetical protein